MDLAYFRVLIYDFLRKDPYIVPEEAPLIIFDIKSDVCMYNNSKDAKHINHIDRRVDFLRNCEK